MYFVKLICWMLIATCLTVSPLHAVTDEHGEHPLEPREDHTRIAADIAQKAGIQTAEAGPGIIERTVTTYGRLTSAPDQLVRVRARFPGVITGVKINLGDHVAKGEVLANVESNDSLKTYDLRSPIDGIVIERQINVGEVADEQPLFVIADLSTLWAELQVFPSQRSQVKVGQKVYLKAEGVDQQATISHLLPSTDNAPYTLARVQIDNADGLLSPGLLVQGSIVVKALEASLTVENSALQSLGDATVVFSHIDNTYEARPLKLGDSDGKRSEVLHGLQTGERYVVDNSFLIKADIEKSGTSHDH